MRLGQFARKYEIPVQELVSYLQDSGIENAPSHPNAKLNESIEEELVNHFDLIVDDKIVSSQNTPEAVVEAGTAESEAETKLLEATEGIIEPVTPAPKTGLKTSEIEADNHTRNEELSTDESNSDSENTDEIIDSAKLLELLESEEVNLDLSKITRIKAPKKELDGLRVVGKIDLPEPKPKKQDTDKSPGNRHSDKRNSSLSEEEKERRRQAAKRKKERYEAQKERRKKEKEQRRLKALKKAHYEEKLKQTKPIKKPKHDPTKKATSKVEITHETQEPESFVGRFWKWLNGG